MKGYGIKKTVDELKKFVSADDLKNKNNCCD